MSPVGHRGTIGPSGNNPEADRSIKCRLCGKPLLNKDGLLNGLTNCIGCDKTVCIGCSTALKNGNRLCRGCVSELKK